MLLLPTVIEEHGGHKEQFDLPSRLLQDRIVVLYGEVSTESAYAINTQLMYLDAISKEPIKLYLNSPGGSVYDGLSITDIITTIESPVYTIGNGMVASMGAFILSQGDKRYCTKNTRAMLHSVSSGYRGTVHDLKIDYEETSFLNNRLHELMAVKMNKTTEELLEITSRDNYMSAEESLEVGLIDEII